MKVLFLDIDGVCNSAAYAKARFEKTGVGGLLDIDPAAAKLVKRIIKETRCSVVLSSTWRLNPNSRAEVKRDVCHFIDVTKNLNKGGKRTIRGYEVQDWLNRHKSVKQYAILDDDSDFLPHQWLFKTTFEHGITEGIAQAVINHLNAGERNAYTY